MDWQTRSGENVGLFYLPYWEVEIYLAIWILEEEFRMLQFNMALNCWFSSDGILLFDDLSGRDLQDKSFYNKNVFFYLCSNISSVLEQHTVAFSRFNPLDLSVWLVIQRRSLKSLLVCEFFSGWCFSIQFIFSGEPFFQVNELDHN